MLHIKEFTKIEQYTGLSDYMLIFNSEFLTLQIIQPSHKFRKCKIKYLNFQNWKVVVLPGELGAKDLHLFGRRRKDKTSDT